MSLQSMFRVGTARTMPGVLFGSTFPTPIEFKYYQWDYPNGIARDQLSIAVLSQISYSQKALQFNHSVKRPHP